MASAPISACSPTKKELKISIKELKFVIKELTEIKNAGFIEYASENLVFGSLYLRVKDLKLQLKAIKKG